MELEWLDSLRANKTSAAFLMSLARDRANQLGDALDRDELNRAAMVFDLYIKARSYAILNKLFFWLSLAGAICVLLWPSLAILGQDFGWELKFLQSAIVQTTVTGIAVLVFAAYRHYKKR